MKCKYIYFGMDGSLDIDSGGENLPIVNILISKLVNCLEKILKEK